MKMNGIIVICALALMLVPLVHGQEQRTESEVAREVQNPLSDVSQQPSQNIPDAGFGRDESVRSLLPLRTAAPFSLNGNWNLITRTVLPLQNQPKVKASNFSLGATNYSTLFTSNLTSNMTWGVGSFLSVPSATINSIKTEKWGGGPSGVVVYTLRAWVGGVQINNIWSFGDESSRRDLNQMLIQPFINYNLPRGWYLTSSPAITANWSASGRNAWTVPVGGGFGKVVSVNGQMLNIGAQGYVYPVRPQHDTAEWTIQGTLQWLFPK